MKTSLLSISLLASAVGGFAGWMCFQQPLERPVPTNAKSPVAIPAARAKVTTNIVNLAADQSTELTAAIAASTSDSTAAQHSMSQLEKRLLTLDAGYKVLEAWMNGSTEFSLWCMECSGNETVQKLYPAYQEKMAMLKSSRASGYGARHPRVVDLEKSISELKGQLVQSFEADRNFLKEQIESVRKELEKARKRVEHGSVIRKPVEVLEEARP